ncbi:MAG: phosphotransferase family protein [Gammaproteobacteria bacterium]
MSKDKATTGANLEPDATTLRAYLAETLPDLRGEISVQRVTGGASNLTYIVTVGDTELVLRHPPFGTKAKTAHDMGREFKVLSCLQPVFRYCPRPLAYCADDTVLGEPFFVMEKLDGLILRRDLPDGFELTPGEARTLCQNLIDVHIELHNVDYRAAGLADFGKPAGYVERQVLGWNSRYQNARTDDVPDNDGLMAWLADNMPGDSDRSAVIHNDYKFDNVVLNADDGPVRISGVLDWEMATLGDPLMDLGCSLAYWVEAGDPSPLMQARMMPTQLPGMMSRREILDYYRQKSGMAEIPFDFYYAFGLFRLSVIAQQIYYRYAKGETGDERFAHFGQMGAILSERAWEVANGRVSV